MDKIDNTSYNNCGIFSIIDNKCTNLYKKFNFQNKDYKGICCLKDVINAIDLTQIIRVDNQDKDVHYMKLNNVMDDEILKPYLYSALLYTKYGDELINNYILNNNRVNDKIIEFFNRHKDYLEKTYFIKNINPKCSKYRDNEKENEKDFIKCYIKIMYEDLIKLFRLVEPSTFDLVVYRGIKINKDDFKLEIGNLIQFNTFASTTLSICTAQKYMFKDSIHYEDYESCNDQYYYADYDFKYIFEEENN